MHTEGHVPSPNRVFTPPVTPELPVTGAWRVGDDPGARLFINIGDLPLESGDVLPDVTIAYQTWGELNADKSNAVLINHALTGWSDVPAWWPSMVGPGMPFDTDRYFIVCPNVIGGCQGSTGPSSPAPDGKPWGSRFPRLTARDQVAAEVALSDRLGIDRYVLSVGPSLGGMRALEWAVMHPQRVGAVCVIGSGCAATGDQIGTASIQTRAIKTDPNFCGGDYYDHPTGPVEGLGIARRIAHLTYRTDYEMDMRFGHTLQPDESGRWSVESYLDHQAAKLARRFDANTYLILVDVMNTHDIGRGRGGVEEVLRNITVPIQPVAIDTDRLFPPSLQQQISDLAPAAEELITLHSPFGHDGFLIEVEGVGNAVRKSLKLGEQHT